MQLDDESNFGSAVDIAAPGYQILATTPTGKYGKGTGTSAAAAIVAGYIRSIIKNTATPGVMDSKGGKVLTFGRVNAEAAVREILKK
ncbi:hypothetical protein Pmar_PMAR026355 [Perkinsus marinus ATCC 50983]|uniref:subtilisin n=1 Tax=Perkinsus marinus (strain ATCC 50983 / TXsc) TaxID=423536 RepID=C5LEI6_PERM5|nr:hypothetical protein Pmar_PMAR026355 [Perkinsus marinus ATCC 50983]EER04804.1 hypothetical protein Pmar_PMAR026355 [Perkinsus marinus ATCC 50983]|eukprot:XP_002772988.1 hypothetical protein Pmar_PMAR026355 [Perkinsus marinus ATCC 50983]